MSYAPAKSAADLARLLNVTPKTIRRRYAKRDLPCIQTGPRGHWRIPAKAFSEIAAANYRPSDFIKRRREVRIG